MKEHSFKKSTSLVCVLALVICMIGQTLNILAAGNPDLPDPSRNDCSITVHKIKRTTGSSIPGNGAEITGDKASSLGIPLPGVEFTLYKVDASQLSGQTITKDLTPKDAKDAATTISAKVTDDKGIVEWKNLEVGYYVLEETKSVANYDKCEMTIIKLPYSSKDGGSWNYNVHVYPKNVRDTAITKEFTDPADAKKYFNKDDKVKYTITGQ
ncbi:MAG: SpaH/EbpB family LPXTG-anchored major pilin, partial [Clostridioides sp.]|nr:SpaH/EbpB family LPXTG-anchored major pilin [Clostridioides sp.]